MRKAAEVEPSLLVCGLMVRDDDGSNWFMRALRTIYVLYVVSATFWTFDLS
jgi:hypothetical protein